MSDNQCAACKWSFNPQEIKFVMVDGQHVQLCNECAQLLGDQMKTMED